MNRSGLMPVAERTRRSSVRGLRWRARASVATENRADSFVSTQRSAARTSGVARARWSIIMCRDCEACGVSARYFMQVCVRPNPPQQRAPCVLPGDPGCEPLRRGPLEPGTDLFGGHQVESWQQQRFRSAPPRIAVQAQPEAQARDGALALPTQPLHGEEWAPAARLTDPIGGSEQIERQADAGVQSVIEHQNADAHVANLNLFLSNS